MEYQYKDAKLHYEIYGSGIPIVMIHGYTCDMKLMIGCMDSVFNGIDIPYKRIYVDLLGMGTSHAPLSFASTDKQLEVLCAFIKEVIQEDVILAGESYGGYLSLGLLTKLKDKVNKVILICPMVKTRDEGRILPKKDYVDYDEAFLSTLNKEEREGFTYFGIVANKATYAYYVNENVPGMKIADYNFLKHMSKKYQFSFDLKKELIESKSNSDVYFFCGKQDICVGYEDQYEMSKVLPRSSFYLFDKAGHNLQIDQREKFHNLLINILKKPL